MFVADHHFYEKNMIISIYHMPNTHQMYKFNIILVYWADILIVNRMEETDKHKSSELGGKRGYFWCKV